MASRHPTILFSWLKELRHLQEKQKREPLAPSDMYRYKQLMERLSRSLSDDKEARSLSSTPKGASPEPKGPTRREHPPTTIEESLADMDSFAHLPSKQIRHENVSSQEKHPTQEESVADDWLSLLHPPEKLS
jgi:hypothetical protein